jgi:hypothetical protein
MLAHDAVLVPIQQPRQYRARVAGEGVPESSLCLVAAAVGING